MTIERSGSTPRMSTIVKHNEVIYLCGQVAGDVAWDIKKQTQECLNKIDGLLADAESNRDHILSVTIYISDMKYFAEMNTVWDAWLVNSEKPARACVEAKMAQPEILVEMSVIAATISATN